MSKIIVFVLFVCLGGCQTTATSSTSLYSELGEKTGVDGLVSEFIKLLHQDELLAELFHEIDDADSMRNLSDFICRLTEGGCEYHGVNLYHVHVGLEVTKAEFDHFVSLFILAMNNTKVPFRAQNKLLDLMAELRPKIIDLQ